MNTTHAKHAQLLAAVRSRFNNEVYERVRFLLSEPTMGRTAVGRYLLAKHVTTLDTLTA